MQSSRVPCHFLPLRPKSPLPSTLFSKVFVLCSSLIVTDQVSNPYQTKISDRKNCSQLLDHLFRSRCSQSRPQTCTHPGQANSSASLQTDITWLGVHEPFGWLRTQQQRFKSPAIFNRLKPSGHSTYRQFNIHNSTFCPHTVCVLCGSENKQRLFPYKTLTDWFL